MMRAGTTLCIPAWNAIGFLHETLACVARQTAPDLRILVSVDGADQMTADVCKPFLGDARFQVVVQPRRLGWVGNMNALIAAAETEFLALMPHDDLPEPDWLASLHKILAAHPSAVCAYSDMAAFGTQTGVLSQEEVTGTPLQRTLDTLLWQGPCVAYRSLIRRRSNADRPYIPTGLPGDVAADTAWIMELARRGDLRREPRVLVRKRYHGGNTHSSWGNLKDAKAVTAAAALVNRMRIIALDCFDKHDAARSLVELAATLRILTGNVPFPLQTQRPEILVAAYLKLFAKSGPPALPSPKQLIETPDAAKLRSFLGSSMIADRLQDCVENLPAPREAAWLRRLEAIACATRSP